MENKILKPFNLQDALVGKAVMLRDGRKAYVRHHETELPVDEAIRLTGFRADGYRLTWCENGVYYALGSTSEYDIIGMYPETRIINGFEVPAPESSPPSHDTVYFTPQLTYNELYGGPSWFDDIVGNVILQRGLVFLRKEDAIANAKAMLGIDPHIQEE